MKKIILTFTIAALAGASLQNARAGDREWAVAGKVLTGLAIASVVNQAIQPAPVYYQSGYSGYGGYPSYCPPTYAYPAPPPVYYAPAPVVVYRRPVYYAPPRVYLPAPVISVRFGPRIHYHDYYRRGRW